ncbi:hypothetical protein [Dactylosporangium sp. CA-139066]|uniref:hypothetical protein n=1 Tax=Dactylosporangium sp. CA-139066 TaxID=3239930 RepID=UPI003D8CEB60
MHVFDRARSDAHQVRDGLRAAGHHARPLHGVLGWWAVTSFGLVGVLLAAAALLWPGSVHALGPAAVGAWLLCGALGRAGGGQVLRARYGGSLAMQTGPALLAVAGVIVLRRPDDTAPGTVAAAAALSLGIAAAVDAAAGQQYPRLPRRCLRARAACAVVGGLAMAAAPAPGLIVAAAVVGLGELVLAVLLLPEVERLASMLGPREPARYRGADLLPALTDPADS